MLKNALIVLAVLVVVSLVLLFLFPSTAYRVAMGLERRLAGLETLSVETGGLQYVYTDSGDGTPLLLLHGFSANKDNWTRVAKHLTDAFRVIAPDLPGFGESTADPALDYSVPAQVERVNDFVRALELERFHLGGSSMGGAIAMLYAAEYPDRVASLWLLAPGGVETAEPSEMQLLIADGRHPLIPATRRDFDFTLDFIFTRRPFLPSPVVRHLAGEAVAQRELYQQIFADLLDETHIAVPFNDIAASLTMPALVVWGDNDRVLHPAGATVLGELIPHVTVIEMSPMGHLPMLEAPRQVAEDYLEFQRRIASP